MKYRVQFLDSLDNVIREVQADARSPGFAFRRGANTAWPPNALRVEVVDTFGRVSASRILAIVTTNEAQHQLALEVTEAPCRVGVAVRFSTALTQILRMFKSSMKFGFALKARTAG